MITVTFGGHTYEATMDLATGPDVTAMTTLVPPSSVPITCTFVGGLTRAGKKMFGLPVDPRPSKGYRRHVRKMKKQGRRK